MTVEEERDRINRAITMSRELAKILFAQHEAEFFKDREALEKRCVAEGGHHDDGGMFMGMCKRCGYCFG